MNAAQEAEASARLAGLGAKELRTVKALLALLVALQDAPRWLRDWTADTVTGAINLEEPPDLSIWAAALEGWE